MLSFSETERENFSYVPNKLSKVLCVKLQRLEERKERDYLEKKRLEKEEKNGGSKKRKKSKRDAKEEFDKMAAKQINYIEQERSIHEAYQLILNEYYRKVRQRRKAMEAANNVFGKVQKEKKVIEMVVTDDSKTNVAEKVKGNGIQFYYLKTTK